MLTTPSPFAVAAQAFAPDDRPDWRKSTQAFAEHLTSFGDQPRHVHLDYLDRVDDLIERAIQAQRDWAAGAHPSECEQIRAVIELPPQHGKTTVLRYGALHFLHELPNSRGIYGSYGATFAATHGRWIRNQIRASADPRDDSMPDLGLRLATDSNAVDRWDLATASGRRARGGMITVGRGGPATGNAAHLLIVDDPFKDMAEADSEVIRESVETWFYTSLLSRLRPVSCVIVLHTRWHTDDLIGRLVAQHPDMWERIRIPALAENNDPLGRPTGAPLGTSLGYGLEFYEAQRKVWSNRAFQALYQQDPQPLEGLVWEGEAIRRNTNTYRESAPGTGDFAWRTPAGETVAVPPMSRVWEFIDPSFSESPEADETGRIVMGQSMDGRAHVLADMSERAPYDAMDLGSSTDVHGTSGVAVETNMLAGRVLKAIREILDRKGRKHIRVHGVKAEGTKTQRAEGAANLVANNEVTFWGDFPELITQCLTWLATDKESPDRMDALVHGCRAFLLGIMPGGSAPVSPAKSVPRATGGVAGDARSPARGSRSRSPLGRQQRR